MTPGHRSVRRAPAPLAIRCQCLRAETLAACWVGAHHITLGDFPYWSVRVAVAALLRADPLEGELRQQMAAALGAVEGAGRVWEDDREVWGVTGGPSGEDLVRAAARVVDHLAAGARAHIDGGFR